MRTLAMLFIGMLCAGTVLADATDSLGTIEGRILTSQGKPGAFFHVIVLGTRRGAITDEKGRYHLTLVPLGAQTLKVLDDESSNPIARAISVLPGGTHIEDIVVPLAAPPPTNIPAELDIGSRAESSELVAEIRSVKETYKFGDSPRFKVRIYNRGSKPVVLVKCVEGSDRTWGPRGEWKIAAPFEGFIPVDGGPQLHQPKRAVIAADFIEVQPGEYFDPYMDGWTPTSLADGAVTRPGHYTATFRYSTRDRSPRAWLGPTARRVSPELLELFSRVTPVELTAKTNFKVDY